MKYALIKNNIVEQISYPFVEGWEEVNDNVFAGMVKKLDGTFDYTDEVKQQIENIEQEKQDAITKKASAKEKLLALGLTEEEIKLTFGV
jgi:phosphosulfolactate phosphohydrolase-like enzyme